MNDFINAFNEFEFTEISKTLNASPIIRDVTIEYTNSSYRYALAYSRYVSPMIFSISMPSTR
jgi:hypothetical protein